MYRFRVVSSLHLIIPILLQFISHSRVSAHKEYVHQYLAIEAFRLLEGRYPALTGSPFAEHLGAQGGGCDGFPFSTGLITTGAYREDCEDPVYHYGDVIPFLDNAYFSASHFWDADGGDRSTIEICDVTCGRFQNAYRKALRYVLPGIHGSWTAKLRWPIGQAHFNLASGGTTWIVQYGQIGFEYDDLAEFYREGTCRITGYNDITGRWQTAATVPDRLPIGIVAPQHVRERIAWEVIGRLAHLLGDLGVPAHSHNDIHPPFWWNNEPADIFEEEMGTMYGSWDHTDAEAQGGVLDVYDAVKGHDHERYIHYLFYTTSQVADRFPSNDADGDAEYRTSWGEDDYSVLNIIDRIGTSPTDRERFHYGAADYAFVFSMRAIAGLYRWFVTESGILNPVRVGTDFPGGYVLIDGKPRSSPARLLLGGDATVTLEAPSQTFTDPLTGMPYRMTFREWTLTTPGEDEEVWPDNPWVASPPYGAVLTAGYAREVDIAITKPRHLEGGEGASYRINGTEYGDSWSASVTEGEHAPVSVEMIVPPGCVFLGWSDGATDNPRSIAPDRHLTVHGLYKFRLGMVTEPDPSRPARRRIASTHREGPGETLLVMVYESAGNIFYAGSTDGERWEEEELINDGGGNASDPAIEYYAGPSEGVSGTFVVWEEPLASGDGYRVMGRVMNEADGTWGQIRDISRDAAHANPGASPVISSDIVVWKGPRGLLMKDFFGNEAVTVPGTDTGSSTPALDVSSGPAGEVSISWRQSPGDIMYIRGRLEDLSWSAPLLVSGGADILNSNPSVAADAAGSACVAWSGGNGSEQRVFYRYITRENDLRGIESVPGCSIGPGLPLSPSLTHYRDDDSDVRDLDIHVTDPSTGNIVSLLIRAGGPVGPVLTHAGAVSTAFPASGEKSVPGNVVVVPRPAGSPPFVIGTVHLERAVTPPAPPSPEFPAPGSSLSDTVARFTWTCAPDVREYRLQVSVTALFSPPLTVDVKGIIGNSHVTPGLTPGTTYYWRIGGTNSAGEGAFSAPVMFSTPDRPAAPLLSGTTVTSGRARYPSLSWTAVPGATEYRVLRYVCPDFADCGVYARHETVYRGTQRSFVDLNTPVGTKLSAGRAWFLAVAVKNTLVSDGSNKISYATTGFFASGNRPEYEDGDPIPAVAGIGPNFPNPFNPSTVVRYQLPHEGHVKISVYNTLGACVGVLVDRDRGPGYFEASWDATGRPPGVYFLEMLVTDLESGGTIRKRQKVLYLK